MVVWNLELVAQVCAVWCVPLGPSGHTCTYHMVVIDGDSNALYEVVNKKTMCFALGSHFSHLGTVHYYVVGRVSLCTVHRSLYQYHVVNVIPWNLFIFVQFVGDNGYESC